MTQLAQVLITLTIGLIVLWLLGRSGWHLFELLADNFLESSRSSVQAQRVLKMFELNQAARKAREKNGNQRVAPANRIDPIQLERQCRLELGLEAEDNWAEIKRKWRQGCLSWHPDQGGDPKRWLTKLQAYETLREMKGR